MTALTVVFNQSAIAMAADSRLSFAGSNDSQQHRDGYRKLHRLSEAHPVGIMVYGNPYFMDHPWQSIIGAYREQKQTANEATVDDWASDFFNFVRNFQGVSESSRIDRLREILEEYFTDVESRLDDYLRYFALGDLLKVEEGFDFLIRHTLLEVRDKDRVLTDEELGDIKREYGELVNQYADRQLAKTPEVRDRCRELAWSYIASDLFTRRAAGIVIAGYGSAELYPALISFKVDGYVGPVLKIWKEDGANINNDATGHGVRSYAQASMTHTFLDGFAPEIEASVLSSLREHDSIYRLGEVPLHELNAMGDFADRATRRMKRSFAKIASENINEIKKMVALMSPQEVLHLATSLVALEALAQSLSDQTPSVGGDITFLIMEKSAKRCEFGTFGKTFFAG